jgi:Ca-activated chloride channel family protein
MRDVSVALMLMRMLLVLLVSCAALIDGRVVAQTRQVDPVTTAFRGGIDIVSVNVTVTSTDQRFVSDLTAGDFIVLENGVPQPLRYFAKSGVPLSMALLIDTSASMAEALPLVQDAAVGFVRQIAGGDVASIIDFETRVEIGQALTADIDALERAIRRTQTGGATSLYNALDIALRELSKPMPGDTGAPPRRRVIIVLSDGADTSSTVTYGQVLDRAVRSETIIYGISLGAARRSSAPLEGDSGELVLRRLAGQTGGRAFFTEEAKDLARYYGQIRDELANQYSLGYEPAGGADGTWRRLEVRVRRPSTTARTRAGYFAPMQ